jgi:hypothetical protein
MHIEFSKKQLGRYRFRREGNIKTNLRQIGCEEMKWTEMDQDRLPWRDSVWTVKKF